MRCLAIVLNIVNGSFIITCPNALRICIFRAYGRDSLRFVQFSIWGKLKKPVIDLLKRYGINSPNNPIGWANNIRI